MSISGPAGESAGGRGHRLPHARGWLHMSSVKATGPITVSSQAAAPSPPTAASADQPASRECVSSLWGPAGPCPPTSLASAYRLFTLCRVGVGRAGPRGLQSPTLHRTQALPLAGPHTPPHPDGHFCSPQTPVMNTGPRCLPAPLWSMPCTPHQDQDALGCWSPSAGFLNLGLRTRICTRMRGPGQEAPPSSPPHRGSHGRGARGLDEPGDAS